jgi:hypothetical protein
MQAGSSADTSQDHRSCSSQHATSLPHLLEELAVVQAMPGGLALQRSSSAETQKVRSAEEQQGQVT